MMKILGTAAALVLLGAVGAHAQVVITDPAPVYVAPAPLRPYISLHGPLKACQSSLLGTFQT
jgi:hypothetical protein